MKRMETGKNREQATGNRGAPAARIPHLLKPGKYDVPGGEAGVQASTADVFLFSELDVEALAALNGRSVGHGARKAAVGTEFVLDEAAIRYFAFYKSAFGERRSLENAIDKLAVDEIGLVKKAPIPLDIAERARHKVGAYMAAFHCEPIKSAELEMIVVP
jgi:hypothetical protein